MVMREARQVPPLARRSFLRLACLRVQETGNWRDSLMRNTGYEMHPSKHIAYYLFTTIGKWYICCSIKYKPAAE